jgi:hypothetical protein
MEFSLASRLAAPLASPILARSSFRSRAFWVSVDSGLFKSAVLSTLVKPTFDLLIPEAILTSVTA